MDALQRDLEQLQTLRAPELRTKWKELFGYDTPSHNTPYLRKQLARRIQELAEGGLSERALARIEELAKSGHLLKLGKEPMPPAPPLAAQVPEPAPQPSIPGRDLRLPPAGTVLRKEHRGQTHEVTVLVEGFEYLGRKFTSLSTIAREITGTNWNGFVFFALSKRKTGAAR